MDHKQNHVGKGTKNDADVQVGKKSPIFNLNASKFFMKKALESSDEDSETDSEEEEVRKVQFADEEIFNSDSGIFYQDFFRYNVFNMVAIAARCQHQQMPLSVMQNPSKASGLFLPYLAMKKCFDIPLMNAWMTFFFMKENGSTVELKEFLEGSNKNHIFENVVLHSITRLQLPNGKFVERIIYVGQIKESFKSCCRDTEHLVWIPCEKAATIPPRDHSESKSIVNIQLIVNRFWGGEVAEYAQLLHLSPRLDKIPRMLLTEYTSTNALKHVKGTGEGKGETAVPETAVMDFHVSCKFTSKHILRLYSEFVVHTYPSMTMSFVSFSNYFSKIGLDSEAARFRRSFNAMNKSENGYISFEEFSVGIATFEHSTEGEPHRYPSIWRYYTTLESAATLDGTDLKLFKHDVAKLDCDSDFLTKSRSLTYMEFVTFLKDNRSKLAGKLLRFSQPLYESIVETAPYLIISNKYSREFRKEVSLRCARCRIKMSELPFTIGAHIIELTVDSLDGARGLTTQRLAIKHPDDMIVFRGRERTLCGLLSKLSTEYVFKQNSLPNQVLTILRKMYGFKSLSSDERKKLVGNIRQQLTFEMIAAICDEVRDILLTEPRLVKITSPSIIIGDIHGNIHDLLIYEKQLWPLAPGMFPFDVLFLGDYVDRGDYSIEVVMYLFAMKILAPQKFFILRGNHEVREIQRSFTFERECMEKYGKQGSGVFDLINQVFDCLPIAGLVNERIFCAHGGMSQDLNLVEELNFCSNNITNPKADPYVWELLWNDPTKEVHDSSRMQKDLKNGFAKNTKRGTAYFWGPMATNDFLTNNNLSMIVRAHELEDMGYKFHHDGKVLTVFSCSRYCVSNNRAAVIWIDFPMGFKSILTILSIQTDVGQCMERGTQNKSRIAQMKSDPIDAPKGALPSPPPQIPDPNAISTQPGISIEKQNSPALQPTTTKGVEKSPKEAGNQHREEGRGEVHKSKSHKSVAHKSDLHKSEQQKSVISVNSNK